VISSAAQFAILRVEVPTAINMTSQTDRTLWRVEAAASGAGALLILAQADALL
jgi:hypothetical protein